MRHASARTERRSSARDSTRTTLGSLSLSAYSRRWRKAPSASHMGKRTSGITSGSSDKRFMSQNMWWYSRSVSRAISISIRSRLSVRCSNASLILLSRKMRSTADVSSSDSTCGTAGLIVGRSSPSDDVSVPVHRCRSCTCACNSRTTLYHAWSAASFCWNGA